MDVHESWPRLDFEFFGEAGKRRSSKVDGLHGVVEPRADPASCCFGLSHSSRLIGLALLSLFQALNEILV